MANAAPYDDPIATLKSQDNVLSRQFLTPYTGKWTSMSTTTTATRLQFS
jgi:hypothetical protein